MKKIISVMMCMMLIFTTNISVHAESNSNLFYEILVDDTVCYTCDDNNLPSSGDYYFGITSNGDVWYTTMARAIPLILNRGLGLALNPSKVVDFITDYITYGIINDPIAKPVMNGNTRVGWALADLTGKKLVGSTSTGESAIIPTSEVNNVYNYYNEWYTDEGYDVPDYINLETRNKTFFDNKFNRDDSKYNAAKSLFDSGLFTMSFMKYTSNTMTYSFSGLSYQYYIDCVLDDTVTIASAENAFSSYCDRLNVKSTNSNVPFVSQMLNGSGIPYYFYDKTDINTILTVKGAVLNNDGTYRLINANSNEVYGGQVNSLICCDYDYWTIYKSKTIFNQFVNKTYAPVSFYTQQWYDYNENNDNSISTSTEEIDNSTTTNETIYNESAESFSEYYEENNYHIDNSITISNTTEIINNYYGDNNGGDDNGGGSGGGSDDSDGSILDKLLDAIVGFFKAVGQIIVALLTGLFELFSIVLNALADINNSFAAIKNFLASIFSWFPETLVSLMVLGLGLALLASFITWFKK